MSSATVFTFVNIAQDPPLVSLSFVARDGAGKERQAQGFPGPIRLGTELNLMLYCVRLDSDEFIGITFEDSAAAENFYKHEEAAFPGLFEVPAPGKTTVWIRRVFTSAHIDKLGLTPPSLDSEPDDFWYRCASDNPSLVQALANVKRKADELGIFGKVQE
jgi:hypothetical protein